MQQDLFASSFSVSRGSSFLSVTADGGKVSAIRVNNSFFMVGLSYVNNILNLCNKKSSKFTAFIIFSNKQYIE
ncbi:hypothetical protein [Commensalibacter nepenthis]|uniref:Uncharacterized protein n=1 Tax=Commensalibacter nepenthis TaxID=3043872 RepID=A0ABT6Q5Q1_9PROT|nr:hypothetical protein [Commensalibacter sp. TBRC 10068]MDI2112087.1 hypothetical protein [Commensalibacter sp. TBRC 10068]